MDSWIKSYRAEVRVGLVNEEVAAECRVYSARGRAIVLKSSESAGVIA